MNKKIKKQKKTLVDVQIKATPLESDTIKTEDEFINKNISLATMYCSDLIPYAGYSKANKKMKYRDIFLTECSNILSCIVDVCNSCYYDLPEELDLVEFEQTIPIEIKVDLTLTLMSMLGALVSISELVNISLTRPIWDLEQIPDEFETGIFMLISGIRIIGMKYDFSISDLIYNIL